MNIYESAEGQEADYSKESTITILSALGHFPEKKVFSILCKYFYSSDMDICCAAIRSSASKENIDVVPHLFQLIDRAKDPVKIEAIRALAAINVPLTVEKLIKYFPIFQEIEVKKEILKAVNSIAAAYKKVAELNRGVLIDEGQNESLKEIAVQGLVDTGDFESLLYYIPHAPSSIQKGTFNTILKKNSSSASNFLKQLEKYTHAFTDTALGIYICAYLLKSNNPKNNFMLNLLQGATKSTLHSYLNGISENLKHIPSVKKAFRILLLLPYWDEDTEKMIDRLLLEVLDLTKRNFPRAMNELITLTTVYLDALFKKISKGYLSVKSAKGRDGLLAVLLARLFERVITHELIVEVQRYFKDENHVNAGLMIERIREVLKNERESDRKRFEACIPLFMETERIKRLNIYSVIKNINPGNPVLLKRLCRVIKAAGWLEIKTVSKKIWEILKFSREEKIVNLEATCIISLCELSSKNIVLDFQQFFKLMTQNKEIQRGYIRGARFLPPKDVIDTLLYLIILPDIEIDTKCMILDTLKSMDLSGIEKVPQALIRLFDESSDNVLNERAEKIISHYCGSTFFHALLDLTRKTEVSTKISGIRILKELRKRDNSIPMDVFTNRLYLLLEDKEKQVQIESVFTLIELGDDYAIKILKDWLDSGDESVLPQVLSRVKNMMSLEVLPHVLSLIKLNNRGIHEAILEILPELCTGKFSNEVKRTLMDYLDSAYGSQVSGDMKREGAIFSEKESLIHHPKIEFRFRREHSQVVTVFFIDIEGYTDRSSRVDMSSLISLVKTFENIVIPLIESFGGHIIKKMGDGILAAFRHPINAVLASLEIQEEVNSHNRYTVDEERFFVRIGLHTGPVIRKDGDIFGDVVNIASRMENAAKPGEILITEATYIEIKDYIQCRELGNIIVKKIKDGIPAYIPEKALEDTRKILQVRKNNRNAFISIGEDSVLEKLKESLFSPQFHLPRGLDHPKGVYPLLEGLFQDMSHAVDEIAHDYHEEYVFKRYLQDKWEEMIAKLLDPPE